MINWMCSAPCIIEIVMKRRGIKNLIIDFGGVLIDLDRQCCLENFRKLGWPKGNDPCWSLFRAGVVSGAFRRIVRRNFAVQVWSKVDFGTGTVTFLDDTQKEDILQVEYPNGFLLDMGWYQDRYIISIIQNFDWTHPVQQYETAERNQLIKALFSLVGLILLFLLGLFLSLLFFLLLHLCKSLYHGSFQQVGSDLAAADTK